MLRVRFAPAVSRSRGMRRWSVHLSGVLLAISLAAATGAKAQDASRERQLEAELAKQSEMIARLEARIAILEAREPATLESVRPVRPDTAPPAPANTAAVSSVPPSPAAPDGTTIKVRGRLHADAWAVNNGASGTELRRARLGVEGRIDGRMNYVLEVDFAGAAVSIQDAFVDYPITANTALRLGYHKAPFSLDDQTSDNYNLFLEHPVGVSPFVPGRGVAVALLTHGDHWFAHGGVFGEGENDARDGLFDENSTYAGRLVWAPLLDRNRYLHLGIAGFRTKFGDAPSFQIRERPERHLSTFVLTTGNLNPRHMDVLGLEAAASVGPLGAAAEYVRAAVGDRSGGDLRFGGYSVEAWWTLTGEVRPYSLVGGAFSRMVPSRPVPDGGFGLWQVAARYSRLDLMPAGDLETASLALNWHLTAHTRLMVDLNRSLADRPTGRLRQTGVGARVQIDW